MNCQQITIILKKYIIIREILTKESLSMKKVFRSFIQLIIFLILALILYFLLSYLLTFFPKQATSNETKERSIYILYSPMHTDIVFNIEEMNTANFPEFKNRREGYLAFGWGDKETYLNTPTWDKLKTSTALKALFINTPSVMHLSYFRDIHRYRDIKKIELSKNQFNYLIETILQQFNSQKKIYRGYGRDDFFYDAKGSYNIINTCNTWTGTKLREANISVSYWTPLSQNVIASLP